MFMKHSNNELIQDYSLITGTATLNDNATISFNFNALFVKLTDILAIIVPFKMHIQ